MLLFKMAAGLRHAGQMREILEKLKGTEILDDSICIKSTLKEEQIEQMDNVVDTIVKSLKI